ncbi:MAG TPA: toprim domain-containing protein, partial [Polyangiaceae bacterium]|nr:toprim domain-containing protein [Polyangiaceae bacterium]
KLRYHRIILMTDADVDGSHIRTLLLTFFFRQIPDILEQGYLYIAQPPLYRVRKGKKDFYIKDQTSLDEYLLENSVDGLEVAGQGREAVSGKPLYNLARSLRHGRSLLQRLDRRYPARTVAAAARAGITAQTLQSEATAAEAAAKLGAYLTERYPDWAPLQAAAVAGAAPGAYAVEVKPRLGSTGAECKIDLPLAESAEYRELLGVEEDLRTIGAAPYVATAGQAEPATLPDGDSLHTFLEERGKRGLVITRYKGLGEMNAEDLWETTMNPDARTLLRVRVDDAVKTDELFTILMGDQVEPRRQFIEENALNVRNLDI